jgi:hypothetical protein
LAFVIPIGKALPSSTEDYDRRRDVVEIVIARGVQIRDIPEDALAPAIKLGMFEENNLCHDKYLLSSTSQVN